VPAREYELQALQEERRRNEELERKLAEEIRRREELVEEEIRLRDRRKLQVGGHMTPVNASKLCHQS